MDPKLMMELSNLVRELPPQQLYKMQTLMHNMMAGFDVSKEMEEFERSLPPGFREKVMRLMGSQYSTMAQAMGASSTGTSAAPIEAESSPAEPIVDSSEMDVRKARLTILRAVSDGKMSPEEAERLLFGEST